MRSCGSRHRKQEPEVAREQVLERNTLRRQHSANEGPPHRRTASPKTRDSLLENVADDFSSQRGTQRVFCFPSSLLCLSVNVGVFSRIYRCGVSLFCFVCCKYSLSRGFVFLSGRFTTTVTAWVCGWWRGVYIACVISA